MMAVCQIVRLTSLTFLMCLLLVVFTYLLLLFSEK